MQETPEGDAGAQHMVARTPERKRHSARGCNACTCEDRLPREGSRWHDMADRNIPDESTTRTKRVSAASNQRRRWSRTNVAGRSADGRGSTHDLPSSKAGL
jgi:hypothetical protein